MRVYSDETQGADHVVLTKGDLTGPEPVPAPGLAAGTALAWARALGEFGATITFAGNFEGRTQTTSLLVYVALQDDPQTAVALSIAMLVVAVAVLGALRGRWLR